MTTLPETDGRIALQAAQIGSQVVVHNFGQTIHIERKQYSEVVTNVDREAEAAILAYLQTKRPDYAILSEEIGLVSGKSDLTWVVDPLDGTSNFVLGIPHVAVSIALYRQTSILVGVVVNALLNLQYTAESQKGALLNNTPLHVSAINILKKATIAHIVSYEEKFKSRALELFSDIRPCCYRLLDTWTPSLDWCMLAQGKVDALISLDEGQFDRLAGMLMVQEAGGLITDFYGNPPKDLAHGYLLASNGAELHTQLLEIIYKHYTALT